MNQKNQKTQKTQKNFKVSIRLANSATGNSVTSVSINIKLLSLWLFTVLLKEQDNQDNQDNLDTFNTFNTFNTFDVYKTFSDPRKIKFFISDFINKKLPQWKNDTGKGLSDFITSCLYLDICSNLNIDPKDFTEFFTLIHNVLSDGALVDGALVDGGKNVNE